MKTIYLLLTIFAGLFTPVFAAGGVYGSRGQSGDFQTEVSYFKEMFVEVRNKMMYVDLAKSSKRISTETLGDGFSLVGNSVVVRKSITTGDELRFTMSEAMYGMSTYGDKQPSVGDYGAFKNMRAVVNMINSPAIPIQGEMEQQRVMASIQNLPQDARDRLTVWMAEELDMFNRYALIYGASPNLLAAVGDGGRGLKLGANDIGVAGVGLMNRHFLTADDGFVTYSTTPATYNTVVATAITNIGTDLGACLSLDKLRQIKAYLDRNYFWSTDVKGKTYRAVVTCDTELYYRLGKLLEAVWATTEQGRGNASPLLNIPDSLEYDGMLFIRDPWLEKLRPTTVSGVPTFGPSMVSDFRTYDNASKNALMIFHGRQAIVEGYNGSLESYDEVGRFKKGMEVHCRTKSGFMRGEWYAQDGRTTLDAVKNYSVAIAAFYEPGVGVALPGA